MDWIISILNIGFLLTTGNKWKFAPLLGFVVCLIWFVYAIQIQKYGLLLSISVGGVIQIRNYLKWKIS